MPDLGKTKKTSAGGRREGLIRPNRTEELQCLYDRWRDSEHCEDFGSLSQLNEDQEHLHVPHGRASMRRSSSQRSCDTTSSTVSSHLVVEGPEHVEHLKKPRRRGPLSKPKRERTAFIRRLGACPPCRSRKVRCKHWDLSEFEASYSLSRRYLPSTPFEAKHLKQIDEMGTLSHGADLLGLEKMRAPVPTHPESAFDFADLLPSFVSHTTGLSSLESVSSQPLIGLGSSSAWDDDLALMQSMHDVAIGKEVVTTIDCSEWHCQFSDYATSPNDAVADTCCLRFSTQENLMEHFQRAHHLFQLPKFWFRCLGCAKWNDEAWHCVQCGLVGAWSQERWIFGSPMSSSSLFSA